MSAAEEIQVALEKFQKEQGAYMLQIFLAGAMVDAMKAGGATAGEFSGDDFTVKVKIKKAKAGKGAA